MTRQLFVNLPVKDLNRTVEFFTTLGFSFNPDFTDENATCMIVNDGAFVMLLMVFVLFLFLANFLIFMGPMMLMGISQIRGYEPGDAEWGVKLEHVKISDAADSVHGSPLIAP